MRHNFIWKIEARLTRVAPGDTADTVGAKGEAAEGVRRLSGLSVAGPSENIRRTVTVVESYRLKRLLHCPEPSHSVGSGLFVLPEPEIPALPQHSPAKFKKER